MNPLLLRLGLPALANIVGRALSASGNPKWKGLGDALGALDPKALKSDKHAEREFRRAIAFRKADSEDLEQVNETFRRELASSDPFVRRWRPTMGYAISGAFLCLIAGGVGASFWMPTALPLLVEFTAATAPVWTAALAVCGITAWRRSDDKKSEAYRSMGIPPPSLIDLLHRK